jgi:membrane-associated phospholipid phosphatase
MQMSIWNNMDWVLPLRTPFLNSFFELVTLGGYPLFLILFLCFGYFALGAQRFFHTAILLMAAGLLNSWLKDIVQDARPNMAYALDGRVGDSYGWPSGHMQIAVVLWGYLAYSLRQIWAYGAAAVIIALMGFSRLYLGVHDVGDVTAGFVFGALCLAAYIAALENQRSRAFFSSLSLRYAAGGLIATHLIYVAIYPAHIGHEAPFWFMGAMTGWLVAHYARAQSPVILPGPLPVQMLLAGAMTGLSFVSMMVLTRLPRAFGVEHGVLQYGFGLVFGLVVIFVLPFGLAFLTVQATRFQNR